MVASELSSRGDTIVETAWTVDITGRNVVKNITVYERNQQLEKEVERLKKELSKQYLTRGRREFLKKGSY